MQKLSNTDYTDGFTTELNKTQKQIIRYINRVGGQAHIKVIVRKAGSYGESTIRENIDKLTDKGILNEPMENSYTTTPKAEELAQ